MVPEGRAEEQPAENVVRYMIPLDDIHGPGEGAIHVEATRATCCHGTRGAALVVRSNERMDMRDVAHAATPSSRTGRVMEAGPPDSIEKSPSR